MNLSNVLRCISFIMFGISAGLTYAFVLDIEPLSPEKSYALEKDIYNQSHDGDWNGSFPSYEVWLDQREESENRLHDYLISLSEEIGVQAAITFDPWYQDTREGHGAQAPDDWARGERD